MNLQTMSKIAIPTVLLATGVPLLTGLPFAERPRDGGPSRQSVGRGVVWGEIGLGTAAAAVGFLARGSRMSAAAPFLMIGGLAAAAGGLLANSVVTGIMHTSDRI